MAAWQKPFLYRASCEGPSLYRTSEACETRQVLSCASLDSFQEGAWTGGPKSSWEHVGSVRRMEAVVLLSYILLMDVVDLVLPYHILCRWGAPQSRDADRSGRTRCASP